MVQGGQVKKVRKLKGSGKGGDAAAGGDAVAAASDVLTGGKSQSQEWRQVGPSVAAKAAKVAVAPQAAAPSSHTGVTVLEEYPVDPPFSRVRIVIDNRTMSKIYQVIEPVLTDKETAAYNMILDTMGRALEPLIDAIEERPIEYLRESLEQIVKGYSISIDDESKEKIFYYLRRDLRGYGKLDPLMRDANMEDVSCDGVGVPLFCYHRKYESVESTVKWDDAQELEAYVIRLAQRCGKSISVAEPLLDATMDDGSRVVMKLGQEISTRGSAFCIRRFKEDPFTPTDIIGFRTMSSLMVAYMWLAVQHGMSMLFVGGTASGKTTSLNAMSLFIPWQLKIVSIEETRELNLPHPNWIPGTTRKGFGGARVGGKQAGEVDMYDLLKAALRERPEYIIVGEIRGPEAYVTFQAMATGHTGYSTIHADSVAALIHRLENKPIEIPRVMLPSLDACTIQIQTRIDGKRVRRTKMITEIVDIDPHTQEVLTNEVFTWSTATDDFEFSGKSFILEKIMVKTNMSQEGIRDELKSRKRVLDWMVLNGIRDRGMVAQVVSEYYAHPEKVMKRVQGG